MKPRGAIFLALLMVAVAVRGQEYFLDQVGEALTLSAYGEQVRLRLSGTLDVEGYHLPLPAPGLLYTDGPNLFNSRLSLFFDAQLGSRVYFFAQGRADRGFDPTDDGARGRLDEYAVRFSVGRFRHVQVQAGKFSTVVGNWVPRHGSWQDPFITAPLPYENLTGIWDKVAARSGAQLLNWAHVKTSAIAGAEYAEKPLRTPIIWGPSYASGFAVFGQVGRVDGALEVKNASLSSHPETWALDHWQHPAVSGRLGYRPNAMWNLGLSASTGTYLRPSAKPTLLAGYALADYRQTVLAHDISFAWHHWQVWAEFYAARFAVPNVANADTFACYTEVKYKFTPRVFGALRWNQQLFARIGDGRGGRAPWGRDTWRIDLATGYRFTPHAQLKFQYSLQREATDRRDLGDLFSAQYTVRF